MIGALAVLVMAMLFVVFGLFRLGDGKGCGSDHCDSCSHDCDLEAGRLP